MEDLIKEISIKSAELDELMARAEREGYFISVEYKRRGGLSVILYKPVGGYVSLRCLNEDRQIVFRSLSEFFNKEDNIE